MESSILAHMERDLNKPLNILMDKLGLIHEHSIASPILYNGSVIGQIQVEVYHLNIYLYLTILLVAFVVFLAIWFAMLLNKNNIDIAERKLNEMHLKRLTETLQEKVQQEVEKNRKSEEIIHNQKKADRYGEDDKRNLPPVEAASHCTWV